MKVLLITTHLNFGGIATYSVELARELSARGHEVYLASSGGDLEEKAGRFGIGTIRVPLNTKSELNPKLLMAAATLGRVVRARRIEIVHAQTRVAQVVGGILGRFTGVPYLATCHGFFKTRFSRRLFPAWGRRTIAVSEAVKRHLVDDFRVTEDRVRLIPNGVDLRHFPSSINSEHRRRQKEEMGLNPESAVIGTIARLSPVKGHKYLLRALPGVLKRKPDIQFFIVGEGKAKQELMDFCREFSLDGKVVFRSNIHDTVLALAAMDVFAFPSLEEGLGIALLEAMACGLPVIASSVGGIPGIVKTEENGLLVPPADPEALAEGIVRLLEDYELASRLGKNARLRVEEKFSLEKMVDRMEEVYREVVGVHS